MEASRTIGQEQQSRHIVVPLHCGGFLPGLSGKVCKKNMVIVKQYLYNGPIYKIFLYITKQLFY